MTKEYIGIDMGGSLLRIAKVDPYTGEFTSKLKIINLENIIKNEDLSEKIIQEVISISNTSKIKGIGICAAGDVNEEKLIIKNSPNSRVKGKITFPIDLQKKGYSTILTNDMKAAVQDSARFGEGKKYKNIVTATYSEGHNAALVRNKINTSQAEMGCNILY